MKMIIQQIKYEARLFFRDSAFIMPLVMVVVFLCVFYSIQPLDVVSGFLMSGLVCFFVMIWIGMSSAQKENPVMEQILLLKMGNPIKYYIGKCVFMVIIALFVAFLFVVYPVVQVLLHGPNMFIRPMIPYDAVNAYIQIAGCGLCGVAFGGLFHPRIVKNRKLATVLTASIAIFSISELGIIDEIPASISVLWVVPPSMLPYKFFVSKEYFNLSQSLLAFGVLVLYAAVYNLVRCLLCHKLKF